MNQLRVPDKGAVVKLGPPIAGEVIITVDPSVDGTTFAAGTQTFLPGAEMPVHKHRDRDTVVFVSKGQARITLNERVINVVPGAMLHVPRGAWYGARNTGTGSFQIAWASAPPGLEAFFRELSAVGASPSAQALQELAQRHGSEFRPPGEAPVSTGRPRPQRRGGRRPRGGGRGPARPLAAVLPVTPSSTPAPAPPSSASTTPAAPAISGAPRGRRRHRRGRGGVGARATPPASAQARREQVGGAPPVAPSAPVSGSSRPAAGRPPSSRRRSRRFKEVYMSGRWVRVADDGPVIAPGPQESGRRGQKPDEDDEPPARLTVPL